jgi:4-hydroxybenzoate polyprenyltransferase
MTPRTRLALTLASPLALAALGSVASRVDDPARAGVLALAVFPLVWLLWALARASAYGHANSYARDVDKIHGRRPRPLPRQEASR